MYLELAINDEAELDNHERKNKGQSYSVESLWLFVGYLLQYLVSHC